MADAPSGGGSSWGAFEVILGILLAIALLSNIGNKGAVYKPLGVKDPAPKKAALPVDTSKDACGLSITSPLSLQKVTDTVRLSGYLQGCDWNPDGTTALFAQVINSSGAPLSEFIAVPTNPADFLHTSFDTTIVIQGSPTGIGYIILTPAIPTHTTSTTARIPLQFVRK